MAACGSFHHIFEKPLPEKPTLLESLSPCQFKKPVKSVEQSTFAETFGELYLKDSSSSSSSSSPLPSSLALSSSLYSIDSWDKYENKEAVLLDPFSSTPKNQWPGCHSSMTSESLQLCTEGLGFESSDDVGDLTNAIDEEWKQQDEKVTFSWHSAQENLNGEFRRLMSSGGEYPPPISCIGKSGKPGVCFKSYRQDGRFVLKQVTIPSQELFHACREDGRLKLHLIQPDDQTIFHEADDNYKGEEENFMDNNVQEATFDKIEEKKNA